ncbi:acetate kinase [Peptoanaerobacter stomatis]|uniref:Acetate kinase n=1 Tax=Peptoanaerobacter stomatis TaxID=796937 RepID=J4W889_9FIRM|nr:acetate kinase [Peptoanaerobacter stomatis]EJU22021.1 acetate kinase [Peptoanaerobacter stomatis]NWO24810.1 acetate kinase [Peptostreptococcaceae bacterium oral taxon 081]
MNILVINCGSSSLKYQFIDMKDESVLAKGLVERIGIEGSVLKHERTGMDKETIKQSIPDHNVALKLVIDALMNEKYGAIKDLSEINAVGHRVVHGGEAFACSVVIDEKVKKSLEDCIDLAPLHNPPNLVGINACEKILPNVPMVAVFDTAFHQTMPASSYLYALPYEYYTKHKIRRYGFHGTSHLYVSRRAAEILGKKPEDLNIITCHLGNGASITAVEKGKSIDTSMGFTPLEGLIMGTRTGDMDPAIVTFLMEKEKLSAKDVDSIMNKKSGVLGLSGVSSDFRDIEQEAEKGNERAQIALDCFHNRVKKYIGAYMAELGHVDAIVFTAGLGENSAESREEICKGMEFLGIELDTEENKVRGKEKIVSKESSKIKIMVIPTNEELVIARDTLALIK